MLGIDYGYGKIRGKDIKEAGYSFICRYLSHSPGKNLSKDEIIDMRSNEIKIVVVWETTENRVLAGYNAGQQDALVALQELDDLGLGSSISVYFACDNDFNEAQQAQINKYFEGVGSKIELTKIGVYGSYDVVRRTLDSGLVTYAWQTYAWSHGKWDERAQLRQIHNGIPIINRVQCDTDQAMTDDFGQF